MLASLLPGLREIRAPLAAGYLWLVVGWLLLHDRVANSWSAPGAVEALGELRDAIGVGGVAAAATFLAYLLGALWEPLSAATAESLWSVRARLASRRRSPWWGGTDRSPPAVARISRPAWNRIWLIGQRLCAEVNDILPAGIFTSRDLAEGLSREFELLLDRYAKAHAEWTHGVGEEEKTAAFMRLFEAERAIDDSDWRTPRDSWWIQEAKDFAVRLNATDLLQRALEFNNPLVEPGYLLGVARGPAEFDFGHEYTGQERLWFMLSDREVTARLFDELPLVARRLVGEQQELFLKQAA